MAQIFSLSPLRKSKYSSLNCCPGPPPLPPLGSKPPSAGRDRKSLNLSLMLGAVSDRGRNVNKTVTLLIVNLRIPARLWGDGLLEYLLAGRRSCLCDTGDLDRDRE